MGIAERQASSIDIKFYQDKALSRPKKPPQVPSNNFEQIYKTSYSHGLEKIYALENIDISTVRTLDNEPSHNSFSEFEELSNRWIEPLSHQMEFDLGDHFKGYIEPFFLREPIQMLGLSKRIENILMANNQKQIQDLLPSDSSLIKWPPAISKSHIDEIHTKLQQYLEGASIHQTKSINFISWLKTLSSDLTPKKAAIAFEQHQIPSIISLSTLERQELRRLTPEKKQEWLKDLKQEALTSKQICQVTQDLKRITAIFIKPWMEKRFNIATEQEILERLIYLAEPCSWPSEVIHWISEMYFEGKFLLSEFLEQLDDGLYGTDNTSKKMYTSIITTAQSYFYKKVNAYPLETLVTWISRELGKQWEGYPSSMVERILRISPHFRVRKDSTGKLIAKLS